MIVLDDTLAHEGDRRNQAHIQNVTLMVVSLSQDAEAGVGI